MAKHPLDISSFIGIDPKVEAKPKETLNNKRHNTHQSQAKPQQTINPEFSKPKRAQGNNATRQKDAPRIEKHYWQQLNPESRRIFTSRMWKEIDFNPMLSELTDLSKLTEKWLRWAIPTFANGIAGGPIKEWFDGKRGEEDFHYILVGEHLKHLKEVRQKRKKEAKQEKSVEPIIKQENVERSASATIEEATNVETRQNEEPVMHSDQDHKKETQPSPELKMAFNELEDHINWFQNYLDSKPTENEINKS